MRPLIVTTSWDDGQSLDLRIADLLDQYEVSGTFYIPRDYLESRLSDLEIRELSKRHEIGAHTITHTVLPEMPLCNAEEEIRGSKNWLEALIGSEVQMFCYPGGFYTSQIMDAVKRAGFKGARTVKRFCVGRPSSSYEMHTTIHMHPLAPQFSLKSRGVIWPSSVLRFLPSVNSLPPIIHEYLELNREVRISPYYLKDWRSLARALFDFALRNGEVYHLWGHSWEIEKFNMWSDLEYILEYVSGRKDCAYATNGKTLSILNAS